MSAEVFHQCQSSLQSRIPSILKDSVRSNLQIALFIMKDMTLVQYDVTFCRSLYIFITLSGIWKIQKKYIIIYENIINKNKRICGLSKLGIPSSSQMKNFKVILVLFILTDGVELSLALLCSTTKKCPTRFRNNTD